MKRFRSTLVAAAILVTLAAPVGVSAAAQGLVTWLVFVDDLHLDFRSTGRLRDLLGLVSSELIRDDDRFAVWSSGPSMLSVDITQDRTLLSSAIKRAHGSGLRVSEIQRGRTEASQRATVALATTRAAISALGQAPAGRRGLIYVSNGYHGGDSSRDQVQELARFAKEAGVTIFAVDPRGSPGAIVDDPRVDPVVWKDYLTTTRATLRMLSEPSGGFVLFETADLSQALSGIDAAMRK
jgi:VWFA-related protein